MTEAMATMAIVLVCLVLYASDSCRPGASPATVLWSYLQVLYGPAKLRRS